MAHAFLVSMMRSDADRLHAASLDAEAAPGIRRAVIQIKGRARPGLPVGRQPLDSRTGLR